MYRDTSGVRLVAIRTMSSFVPGEYITCSECTILDIKKYARVLNQATSPTNTSL